MTRKEHLDAWLDHWAKSCAALERFNANVHDADAWAEHKAEYKLANKHYGIAQMMLTKQMKKYQ